MTTDRIVGLTTGIALLLASALIFALLQSDGASPTYSYHVKPLTNITKSAEDKNAQR